MKNASNNHKLRRFAGFLVGVGLSCAAIAVVAPALMDPGPPAAVGRGLNMAATETGREAYIAAMKAQGYEILPPVSISELQSPAQ